MNAPCFGMIRSLALRVVVVMMAAGGAVAVAQQPPPDPDAVLEAAKKQWQQRDPVVEALTAGDATTPAQWFQVAEILARRERPDLAKEFLQKILAAKLDDAALVKLADRFGTTAFARLAARPELLPEADQLADLVLAAVAQQRESPERLTERVKQLASPDERVREEAAAGLREAGSAAVAPLVAALADPGRSEEYSRLRFMLAGLGTDAVRPLLAYLDAGDPAFVAKVINALAQIDDRDASLYLLAPYSSAESDPAVREAARSALARRIGRLPNAAEAARVLARRARRYFDGEATVREDENGQTTIWQWDPESRQAVPKMYPAAAARAVIAARLARDAMAVAPNDPEIRWLYLLTTLEAASYEAGLDEALSIEPGTPAARAAEFGTPALLAALDDALRTGHAPAATAAVRILGQTATPAEALNTGPTPSPLARALRSPDRRTRMAAIEAIARLKPTQPFAGSSYLGEAMAYLASSTGTRRAMVAARNTAEARRVGGYLAPLGFEVETAVTGSEMLRRLLQSSDYELVLVDARIDLPPIGILLQQIRHDARLASLPVGILGSEGFFDVAEQAARDDRLALALVRPHDAETVRWQVERLENLAAPAAVAPELRHRQATAILAQLAALAGKGPGVIDLGRVEKAVLGAARQPQTSDAAMAMLEKLGTPESQKTLVDLASDRRQPVDLRRAALSALVNTVERNGILLTTDQILTQYDRYNQSATADKTTQQILGLILDCLEAAGGQKRAGSRSQGSVIREQESGSREQE